MKRILLIMISASMLLYPAFSRDSNGVVTDSKSRLEWQNDDTDYVKFSARFSKFWEEALIYCEELTLGGQDDWRLPNIIELESIVDDTKDSPAVNSAFVSIDGKYWSSTTVAISDLFSAWCVDFFHGFSYFYDKADKKNIMCVRGGE